MYQNINIESLSNINPRLSEGYCQEYNSVDTEMVFHTISKDNEAVLRISINGKWKNLGSIYYYNKEVDKWLEKYNDLPAFSSIILLGFGNGNILRKLLNKIPVNVDLIIYEPSLDIFSYVMNEFDISDVLANERVHLIVKPINTSDLDKYISEHVDESNYKICRIDALPAYGQCFNDEYEKLKKAYTQVVQDCISDQLSVSVHGRLEVENSIYNLGLLENCYCIDQLIGLIPTELPAVIVSAGPSLEKNGSLLHNIKNRLFIIAVDTALPYLLSIGVMPDLAVSVSPNKDTTFQSLYKNPVLKKIPFAIDAIVTHSGIKHVADRGVIFASASAPYYAKLFASVRYEILPLENGGSVSTIALSLAKKLGFTKYVMIGLDLALKEDKLYAGDMRDDEVLKQEYILIDGYYGTEVATLPTYKMHLDWFEMFIRSNPELKIINSTEGGAMIHGADNIPLSDVVNLYCKKECDYRIIFDNIEHVFSEEQKKWIYECFENSIDNLTLLKTSLESGLELIKDSYMLMNNGVHYYEKDIVEKYKEISNIIDICGEIEESFFVERIANENNGNILEDINIGERDPEKEYLRILEKLEIYFKDMLDAADVVEKMFSVLIDERDEKWTK